MEAIPLSANREDTVKLGMAECCRGCRTRSFAHSTKCRDWTIEEILRSGDKDERVKTATETQFIETSGTREVPMRRPAGEPNNDAVVNRSAEHPAEIQDMELSAIRG